MARPSAPVYLAVVFGVAPRPSTAEPTRRPARSSSAADCDASAVRQTRVCSGFISGWFGYTSVDRHWTHLLVTLSGVLAGAVIFAAGDATSLAAGVTAVGAAALLLPEVASDGRTSPR